MTPNDPSIPPSAPDVSNQQQNISPVAQYAEGAQQAGFGQQQTGMQLVEDKMNKIAKDLTDVAKVLQMENPVLLEYVKKISQIGAEFMKEIQASKQQQSQGMGPRAGVEPSRAGGDQGAPPNALAA